MLRWLVAQRFALVGPAEGLGHRLVVVGDEGEHPGDEVGGGAERAAAEELAGQDTEPELDLIEPGGVPGRVMEDDPVACHTLNASLRWHPSIPTKSSARR